MTGPCIGCGRTAERVSIVMPDATIDGPHVCDRCLAESFAERDQVRAQHRRLKLRGFSDKQAGRLMCRRVDRYFRNGTFRPLARRAVA
jgi:hypothetical protein